MTRRNLATACTRRAISESLINQVGGARVMPAVMRLVAIGESDNPENV